MVLSVASVRQGSQPHEPDKKSLGYPQAGSAHCLWHSGLRQQLGAYYLADKLSGALPALSCAYDHNGSDLCTLIPFQHQMDHRLGPIIADGGNILMGLMPTLITLGTFLLLFVFLNKAFCGWICPLGTFQELLHLLSQKLGLQRRESLEPGLVEKIRPVKWVILAVLVFIFPLLTGLGWLNHDLGDPFCRICPSRILTTLPTVIPVNCLSIRQTAPPWCSRSWPTLCSA